MWPPRAVWAAVCQQAIPEEARNLSAIPQPLWAELGLGFNPPSRGYAPTGERESPETVLIPSSFATSSHPISRLYPILLPDSISAYFPILSLSSPPCHPTLLPEFIPFSSPTSSHPPSQLHPILLRTFTLIKSKGKEALGNTLILHSPKD